MSSTSASSKSPMWDGLTIKKAMAIACRLYVDSLAPLFSFSRLTYTHSWTIHMYLSLIGFAVWDEKQRLRAKAPMNETQPLCAKLLYKSHFVSVEHHLLFTKIGEDNHWWFTTPYQCSSVPPAHHHTTNHRYSGAIFKKVNIRASTFIRTELLSLHSPAP